MPTLKKIKLISKGIPRWRGGPAESWETIIKRYEKRIKEYLFNYEPMLNLVQTIAASPVASELFPTTSMHSLLITNTDQFFHDDNVLFVRYDSKEHEFEFEHRTLSGKNDKKVCDEKDAIQTLSLFLKYKFGVLLNPKRAA
jgi:hypothetical protein